MANASQEDITRLLIEWGNGEREALDQLVPILHLELRRLASRQMRRERPGHSLDTTALVNEAYLRLVDYRRVRPRDRSHFLAIAAQAMRRILVERARAVGSARRGGRAEHVALDDDSAFATQRARHLLALDGALEALATYDPRKARIVELKYFGGLTIEETAEVVGVSTPTVEREWRTAKLWLHRELAAPPT